MLLSYSNSFHDLQLSKIEVIFHSLAFKVLYAVISNYLSKLLIAKYFQNTFFSLAIKQHVLFLCCPLFSSFCAFAYSVFLISSNPNASCQGQFKYTCSIKVSLSLLNQAHLCCLQISNYFLLGPLSKERD